MDASIHGSFLASQAFGGEPPCILLGQKGGTGLHKARAGTFRGWAPSSPWPPDKKVEAMWKQMICLAAPLCITGVAHAGCKLIYHLCKLCQSKAPCALHSAASKAAHASMCFATPPMELSKLPAWLFFTPPMPSQYILSLHLAEHSQAQWLSWE